MMFINYHLNNEKGMLSSLGDLDNNEKPQIINIVYNYLSSHKRDVRVISFASYKERAKNFIS